MGSAYQSISIAGPLEPIVATETRPKFCADFHSGSMSGAVVHSGSIRGALGVHSGSMRGVLLTDMASLLR